MASTAPTRPAGVAQRFGIEPADVLPPEKLVLGIDGGRPSAVSRDDLPIRGRHHDQSMQFLDRPAALHELDGQPIEQLGMRRPCAAVAEIVRRRDEARAEMLLPDAVDDDPRGPRVVGRSDPVRQRADRRPVVLSRGGWIVAGPGVKTRDESRRNFLARRREVALIED